MNADDRARETEKSLKAKICADLPAEAFKRHPWRLLLIVPLVVLIVGGSLAVVALPLPLYAALSLSLAVGILYASFFFFGHEVAHGAVVRSRRIKHAVLYLTCLIYCISPRLWIIWHNETHHGCTNMPGHDPDTFGTLDEFRKNRTRRLLSPFAPGSGHWLSILYLLTFFTLQSQGVLWRDSYNQDFRHLQRWRAILDAALMAAFWLGVSVWTGARGALYLVIIPMLTVNFVMMSYVVTNHMMRPLVEKPDSLDATMSVSTLKIFDLVFFNFSHHVEHHLFPSMSPRYYPLVRRSLWRHARNRYLAPNHWRALLWTFRTPRVYEDFETLVQPLTGRRVSIPAVEAALRASSERRRPQTVASAGRGVINEHKGFTR